jgi:hypothetical protein
LRSKDLKMAASVENSDLAKAGSRGNERTDGLRRQEFLGLRLCARPDIYYARLFGPATVELDPQGGRLIVVPNLKVVPKKDLPCHSAWGCAHDRSYFLGRHSLVHSCDRDVSCGRYHRKKQHNENDYNEAHG